MIRKNYSLADERRKYEKQQQAKIQKRQKHQHKQAKLETIDPVKLYFQIQRLEKKEEEGADNNDFSDRDRSYLQGLRDDWEFIVSNGLHKRKIEDLLQEEKSAKEKREKEANKLWGKQSVYFNPELNPLGKVPSGFPNLTKEQVQRERKSFSNAKGKAANKGRSSKLVVKSAMEVELVDFEVKLPEGQPPMFYKDVQNYQESATGVADRSNDTIESEAKTINFVPSNILRKRALKQRNSTKKNSDSTEEHQQHAAHEEGDESDDSDIDEDTAYGQDSSYAPEEEEWKRRKI